jgi:cytochrome P450
VDEIKEDSVQINLLDPGAYRKGQPFAQMAWLQEHDPVHWHTEPNDGPGFWALTRHADVRTVHSNPKIFASHPTITVQDSFAPGDENHPHLICSDPPHHTAHRRFMGEELTPGSVRGRVGQVEDIVRVVIDEVIEQGQCDLVWDLAGKLASFTAADLIGIPRHDGVEMYEVADRLINAESTQEGDGIAAATELYAYAASVRADRLAAPRDDLATRYARGVVDGVPSDEMQFFLDFMMIFGGAVDTSRNVLAGGMDAFFENPDQWARLVSEPELVPAAVEEMIRWVTPIVYQRRTATEDTQIGDQRIPAGQKVASFFGAANRDPRVFDEPRHFRITRPRNGHIAFGFGPHFCLGVHLARLQLSLMLAEMVRRMPSVEPTAPTQWMRKTDMDRVVAPAIIGPQSMPVRFQPGPRLDAAVTA